MLILLKSLAKVLKVLKDGATPNQIAGGVALGFVLGMTPGWPLQMLLILFITLLLNVNLTMAGVATLLGATMGLLLDPLINMFGRILLQDLTAFKGLYTAMYNNPFLMLTRFNNTVVMGSLVVSLLLAAPVFFLSRRGVVVYRKKYLPKMDKFKVIQLLKGSKLYGLYVRLDRMGVMK
ncbi:MAG: TIGR03546 family protein [Deltaproteobacteria bacterium]|nr:TIGR03546 family protein [Deltaproteobacteria bacterium]